MTSTGRTVLVTGASSGIGRAVALQLAARGQPGPARASPKTLDVVLRSAIPWRPCLVTVPTSVTPRPSPRLRACRRGSGPSTGWSTPPPRWPTDGSRTSPPSLRRRHPPTLTGTATSHARRCGRSPRPGRQPRRDRLAAGQDHTPYMSSYVTASGACTASSAPCRSGSEHPGVDLTSSGPVAWTPRLSPAGRTSTPRSASAPRRQPREGRPAAVRARAPSPRVSSSWRTTSSSRVPPVPAVFDAIVTPLMRVGGLSSARSRTPVTCCLRAEGEALHGRWAATGCARGTRRSSVGAGHQNPQPEPSKS